MGSKGICSEVSVIGMDVIYCQRTAYIGVWILIGRTKTYKGTESPMSKTLSYHQRNVVREKIHLIYTLPQKTKIYSYSNGWNPKIWASGQENRWSSRINCGPCSRTKFEFSNIRRTRSSGSHIWWSSEMKTLSSPSPTPLSAMESGIEGSL